jgi:hypothetical protein
MIRRGVTFGRSWQTLPTGWSTDTIATLREDAYIEIRIKGSAGK